MTDLVAEIFAYFIVSVVMLAALAIVFVVVAFGIWILSLAYERRTKARFFGF